MICRTPTSVTYTGSRVKYYARSIFNTCMFLSIFWRNLAYFCKIGEYFWEIRHIRIYYRICRAYFAAFNSQIMKNMYTFPTCTISTGSVMSNPKRRKESIRLFELIQFRDSLRDRKENACGDSTACSSLIHSVLS